MSTTAERPAKGLVIHQPRKGFRYAAEAFWLVGFALEGGTPSSCVDLGTGSGVMAALLAAKGTRSLGVDVRREWLPLWRRTLAECTVQGRLQLLHCDVNALDVPPVDLVVSNPPFFPSGTGPVAPDVWKAAARTESSATVMDFVRAAARVLQPAGRACVVVPVDRRDDVLSAAAEAGLTARRQVWVGRRRWLVELRREPGECVDDVIDEESERCARWYALARGLSA